MYRNIYSSFIYSLPGGSDGKESACNARDLGSIPGLGRSPGEGNSYPLGYTGLENSMDRGTWQATVHGIAKSRTWLSNFHFTIYNSPKLKQPKGLSTGEKINKLCFRNTNVHSAINWISYSHTITSLNLLSYSFT